MKIIVAYAKDGIRDYQYGVYLAQDFKAWLEYDNRHHICHMSSLSSVFDYLDNYVARSHIVTEVVMVELDYTFRTIPDSTMVFALNDESAKAIVLLKYS